MHAFSRKIGKMHDSFSKEYAEMFEILHGLLSNICVKANIKDVTKELLNGLIFLQFISKSGLSPTDFLYDFFHSIPERISDSELIRAFLIPAMKKICGAPDVGIYSEWIFYLPFINHEIFSNSFFNSLDNNSLKQSDSSPGFSSESKGIIRTIYSRLNQYKWSLDEFGCADHERVTPWILGYIHESMLEDAHGKGAYYTDMATCDYISLKSILSFTSTKIRQKPYQSLSESELINFLNASAFKTEDIAFINDLVDILKEIKICDNACGSGNFLVSCMNILIEFKLKFFNLQQKIDSNQSHRPNPLDSSAIHHIIKTTLQKNLFGVDINPESVAICKMRLWLCYLSKIEKYAAQTQQKTNLFILPNIHYNVQCGNSVIGFGNMRPKKKKTHWDLFNCNELNDEDPIDEIIELESRYLDTQEPEHAGILVGQI